MVQTDPNKIEFQLLGLYRVSVNGVPIPAEQWKQRRTSRIVKLLALAPGHRLHRDQVIDTLWPDAALSTAANRLYQALFAARQLLDPLAPGCLRLEEGSLSFASSAEMVLDVDVEQFEAAVKRAIGCQDPQVYQEALAIYQGDLLPEDLYEDWTIQRREALRQSYLNLLLELARLYETRGEYAQGITTLQKLLATDRSHEEAHAALMRSYALSGQRQQALRQYQVLRAALHEELDVEPDEATIRLYETIQSGRLVVPEAGRESGEALRPDVAPAPPRRLHNLPHRVSSFIGREQEIDQVIELLHSSRLLTITGSGGVGKTSLAVQSAIYLSSAIREGAAYPDGIWLVELASLDNSLLIPETCATKLELPLSVGQTAQDVLLGFLEHKTLLLILDNCEHLLVASARFTELLLKSCPSLAVLTTSREPLGLPGETTYRLPSLAVVDADRLPPLEALAQVESVRLFVERAGKVSPGFSLTPSNAPAVAQIGRRLDGIPLAIELAAVRVRMMTVEQIAARLDDAFHLLTGGSHAALPRQQTLKATIDWSYDLLDPKERLFFQRLSVFAGGWTLEAAETVCADIETERAPAATAAEEVCADQQDQPDGSSERIARAEVLDLLGKLIDKSLILMETSETKTRYHLLETIRQYARMRLEESGDSPVIRDRHLEYYARLTGEAEPHLRGKGAVDWLDRLEDELDNLRSALDRSRTKKIETGLKIAADLMWYWHIRCLFREGADWFKLLLEVEAGGRAGMDLVGERLIQRARALRAYSNLLFYIVDWTEVPQVLITNLQESAALLRQAGIPARRELGISLSFLLNFQGSLDQPSPEKDEMLAIFKEESEGFYLSEYLYNQAGSLYHRREFDQAEACMESSLAISRAIEDMDGIASRTKSLGLFALLKGKYQQAETFYQEALELSQKMRNHWLELDAKVSLLSLAIAQGNYAAADRIGEVVLSTFRELNLNARIYQNIYILLRSAWAQGDYARVMNLARDIPEKYPDNAEIQRDAFFFAGRAALSQNDLSQAEDLLKKAISLYIKLDNLEKVYIPLGYASLFMKQGRAEAAALLLGAIDWLYQHTSGSLSPRERSEHDETLAAARSSLGESAFEQAWKAGQAITLDQAIQYMQENLSR